MKNAIQAAFNVIRLIAVLIAFILSAFVPSGPALGSPIGEVVYIGYDANVAYDGSPNSSSAYEDAARPPTADEKHASGAARTFLSRIADFVAAETAVSRFSQLREAATFLRDDAGITSAAYRRQVIESFGADMRVGTYSGQAYQYSGAAGTASRYVTPTSLSNPVVELALPPSNPATLLQQYSVSPTRALMGTAGPQNFGIPLPGGAQQIFLPSRSVLTPTLSLP